jgi:hypothetical protein
MNIYTYIYILYIIYIHHDPSIRYYNFLKFSPSIQASSWQQHLAEEVPSLAALPAFLRSDAPEALAMAAPQGGMVPKGLAQGQQGGEIMGKSWGTHGEHRNMERTCCAKIGGKGWKRMEKEQI